jgi:hypothetical protein
LSDGESFCHLSFVICHLSSVIQAVQEIGKFAVIAGIVLVAVGVLLWKFPAWFGWLGHLPGDIAIGKGNFRFYFPIATCILISIVLTIVSWVLRR